MVSSRLLEFELWTRIHARGLGASHGEHARALLGRVALLEMIPEVLDRARRPFPVPLRTLDALHLAALDFLNAQGQEVRLASYDGRMLEAGRTLDIATFPME